MNLKEEKIRSLFKTVDEVKANSISGNRENAHNDFLLDPDEQEKFREKFLKKVAEVPRLIGVPLYVENLKEELDVKLFNSDGAIEMFRKDVKNRREVYSFHKYKLLVKPPTTERMDRIQFEVEELTKKLEHLKEVYIKLASANEFTISASISSSDIFNLLQDEVHKYDQLEPVLNFSSRLSWLCILHKHTMWKKYAERLKTLKEMTISRMKLLTSDPNIGKIKRSVKLVTNINAKNLRRQEEMMKKVHAQHSVFAEEHLNINDEILNSHFTNFDLPPVLLNNNTQLNNILQSMSREFGFISSLKEADGYTITDQISTLLPQLFEIQKEKLKWIPYGDQAGKEKMRKKLQKLPQRNISKLVLRKVSSIGEPEENNKVLYKVIQVKEKDWASNVKIKPKTTYWEKRQMVWLQSIIKNDTLLENAFASLDIQNLAALTKLLDEFSMTYPEKSGKRGSLRNEIEENEDDMKKHYLSTLLLDKASSQMSDGEPVTISTSNLKSLYTLKLLKSRDLKHKLLQILNSFLSVERKITLDIADIPKIQKGIFVKITIDNRDDILETVEDQYFVHDVKGEYLMYDIIYEEYAKLTDWMIKLGTFFIEKHEILSTHNTKQYPPIDRDMLMSEILEEEVSFTESKLLLVKTLMQIYDNLTDTNELLAMASYVLKIIAMRPRLNLSNSYFCQSYWAHSQSLLAQNNFFSALYEYFIKEPHDIKYSMGKFLDIVAIIEGHAEDLCLDFEIVCYKEISIIECTLWEFALDEWKKGEKSPDRQQEILDWEKFRTAFYEIIEDVNKGNVKNAEGQVITQHDLWVNMANFLKMILNIKESQRQIKVMEKVQETQIMMLKNTQNAEIIKMFAYEGYDKEQIFPYKILEIDQTFAQGINFLNPTCIKRFLCGIGILDLVTSMKYDIFFKQILEISLRTNYLLVEKKFQHIAEIELVSQKSFIVRNSKINWMVILGRKGEGVIMEKVESEIKRILHKVYLSQFLNVNEVKNYYIQGLVDVIKEKVLKRSQNISREKYEIIIENYCKSVYKQVFVDCNCIQLLKIIKEIRKVLKIIPEKKLKGLLLAAVDKTQTSEENILRVFNVNNLEKIENVVKKKVLNKKTDDREKIEELLGNMIGLLRFVQISFFISLLKFNSTTALEIFDIPTLEKHNIEEVDPFNTTIIDEYKDNQGIQTVSSCLSSILRMQITDWKPPSSNIFTGLSISLYELLNKALLETSDQKSLQIQEFMSVLYNFSPKVSGHSENNIVQIGQKLFIHDNKKPLFPGHISGGYLQELDWGLIEVSIGERVFAWELASNTNFLNDSIEKYEDQLRLHRLKTFFIQYRAEKSGNSISYSDCLQLYNDFVLDQSSSQEDSDTRKIALLLKYFADEICIQGINLLEACLKDQKNVEVFPAQYDFSCNFDTNYKDSTSKIGCLHSLFNSMRNRCTRVETPTAGFALVFFLKDFTYFIRRFTENYLNYNNIQYYSDIELMKMQMEFLNERLEFTDKIGNLYVKDTEKIEKGFDDIVSSNVTHKGSEIIYNLDSIHRQLREIKENTRLLEKYTRVVVNSEFKERFDTKDREISDVLLNYKAFQSELAQHIQHELEVQVSEGISEVILLSSKTRRQKLADMLAETKDSVKSRNSQEKKRQQSQMASLRIFNKWALINNKNKIEKEIDSLKTQLSSNQKKWEELNHTQRRETILKQELANAQNNLSTSEKLVEKLQQDIEEINTERLRLQIYRENKGGQVKLLEEQVKQEKSSSEAISQFSEFVKKNLKIKELQDNEVRAGEEFLHKHDAYQQEIRALKNTLDQVRNEKTQALDHLAIMKGEIDSRTKAINWREKYIRLQRNLTQSTSKTLHLNSSSSRSPVPHISSNYLPQINERRSRLANY